MIKRLGLASLVLSNLALATSPMRLPADTIYYGGNIITMNDKQPTVAALAVRDGRIYMVDDIKEVQLFSGPDTKVVNLNGKTLIPGLIDAHGHVFNSGIQALAANLLSPPDGEVTDMASLGKVLKEWGNRPENKQKNFILGFGYDDSQLNEKRHPTRHDLDKIAKDTPIVLMHQSGHLATMNTKALALAGITPETANPKGGIIRRDADGKTPNGVLEESALFVALLPLFSSLGDHENETIFKAGMDLYAKHGYTTSQEGRASSESVKTMYRVADQNKLMLDVVAYPDIQIAQDVLVAPYMSKTYHNGFRVGGAKLNLDGSPQGKTAWLSKPYEVAPEGQAASYAGYPSMPNEEATKLVKLAGKNNWQLLVHVNGDAAIDQLIQAVKANEQENGQKKNQFVAIHAQTARKDQVKAFKQYGIFPSFFPMHTFYWGDWHRESVLGKKRANNISPTGWALDEGMIFTSHHDAPVALPDAMRVLSATVNRSSRSGKVLGKSHRVSPWIGLKTQTIWAAEQYGEADIKGTLEVGKYADLVILSDNPLTVKPSKLADIKVEETIKEGKTVYRRVTQKPATLRCITSIPCKVSTEDDKPSVSSGHVN